MSEDAGSIRELDPQTVERIAAGEVVERPASVVKELVENSLDADASRVSVAIERGGKDGIRVTDDGEGMTESAVRRAVEQHTTSKIRDVDDLESGVSTLGFRGEALHAIGAVSRSTIETRARGKDTGTKLRVEGGEVTTVQPTGCPVGTTITVADLFYNVPARRKYLKQDGTEFAHVNTIVTSYALANPDVAVSLEHDGRETVATTGEGDLRDAVMAVYGREVASGMVDVAARDDDGSLPEGPLDGVTGLVSHPETNRASNEYVSTYVNGRYVRSGTVREAIVDAYGTQLASDRYPFAVCFLDLPGDSVDVNVHPRKMEVRFADPDGVRSQVRTAVEDALLEAGLVRSSAPRGRSAPAQTEIQPGGEDDGGDSQESTSASSPPTERRDSIGPADVRDASTDTPGSDDPADGRTGDVGSNSRPADDSGPADGAGSADAGHHGRPIDAEDEPDADVGNHGSPDGARFRPATEQTRLGEGEDADGDEGRSFERLPAMRVLGQLHDTYLVAETPDGLVLVDQHAADERVNYERLRERLAGETTTQTLADPVSLSLTAREAALFETYEAALASLGFGATRTGDRTVEVGAVPELVAEAAGPELLREVLSAFVTGEAAAAETVEATADDLLADLACYPSITGNTSLTEGSVRTLLAALDDCENPWACPHGRPVVIELDREEVEARFERDYPGHGGH